MYSAPLPCDTLMMSLIWVIADCLGWGKDGDVFPPNSAAPNAGTRKEKRGKGGTGSGALDLAGLVKATPLYLIDPGLGWGAAHQLVLGVPSVGVAVLVQDGLQPHRVGIAHHRLGWGQERH